MIDTLSFNPHVFFRPSYLVHPREGSADGTATVGGNIVPPRSEILLFLE